MAARITLPTLIVCLSLAGKLFAEPYELSPGGGSDQVVASFAAGAVGFEYQPEWIASELPRRRQILLVLSRDEAPQSVGELNDGVWFAYHPKSRLDGAIDADLAQSIRRELRRAELSVPQPVTVAECEGVRQEFSLPRQSQLFSSPTLDGETPNETPAGQARRGWRMLLATETGRVEIHFVAPTLKFAERSGEIQSLLATLKLSAPQMETPELAPEFLPAEPVIGCWKSARGVLQLSARGKVTLSYDRNKNYRLDQKGIVDYEKPVKQLTGTFEPFGDVLRISWKDGSLLNMRWRLAGSDMLITDHHGRTERLSRVYR